MIGSVLQWLGHFHPVVVHVPIGIFVLLALVELVALFPRAPKLARLQRTVVLVIGLVFVLATTLFGWLRAREGGYDVALLERHQQFGLIFAAFSALLLAVHILGSPRIYEVLLVLTVATMGLAGHMGGSITHGTSFLAFSSATTTAPARRSAPTSLAEALVFSDLVHPILEQRCVSCHGSTKSNGDLRLDTLNQLLRGGKSGPALQAGDAAGSRMVQRIRLPLEVKEHMPPQAKPQLTDDESALIEWWIESGPSSEKRIAELAPPPAIAELINTRLGGPADPIPDRTVMLAAAERLERQLGIIIRPLSADGPWLSVTARLQFEKFGDEQLSALAPIASGVRWLDLGETKVSDAGLIALRSMKQLRRLQLDRTAVTDAGVEQMDSLVRLEMLNLHTTNVSDASFAALRKLPQLRALYLWQTRVSPMAAASFADQQIDKRKVGRLKAEVDALQARIRREHFTLELGAATKAAPAHPAGSPPQSKEKDQRNLDAKF